MRSTTVLGLLLGIILLIIIIFGRGSEQIFWNVSALSITLGGTIAATLIHYPAQYLGTAIIHLKVIISAPSYNPQNIIDSLVELASKARIEGFLALEQLEKKVSEPLLKKGLELIIDETDINLTREILETYAEFQIEPYRIAERVFRSMGKYAPMFGLVGTLVGLIQMLAKFSNPEDIPPAMAVALVTTLYGILLSGLIFLPIAGKIRLYADRELLLKEMMIEGLLAIQSGYNSIIVAEKLSAFLTTEMIDD